MNIYQGGAMKLAAETIQANDRAKRGGLFEGVGAQWTEEIYNLFVRSQVIRYRRMGLRR